jgi:phage replication O-like protein O
MTPQLENGYTSLANEILDEILKLPLSNYEFRIMFAVIRKTYGYHKKDDLIALSQLSKMTFIPISHCSRTVKKLKEKNILSVTQTGKSATLNLAIQKDFSKWILLPKQDSSLTQTGNLVLPKQVSTKDTSTKENITKDTLPKKPKKIVIYTEEQKNNFTLFQEWIDDFAPKVNKLTQPFTIAQYVSIIKNFNINAIHDVLMDMDNKKDLLKRYDVAFTTCNNWLKRQK